MTQPEPAGWAHLTTNPLRSPSGPLGASGGCLWLTRAGPKHRVKQMSGGWGRPPRLCYPGSPGSLPAATAPRGPRCSTLSPCLGGTAQSPGRGGFVLSWLAPCSVSLGCQHRPLFLPFPGANVRSWDAGGPREQHQPQPGSGCSAAGSGGTTYSRELARSSRKPVQIQSQLEYQAAPHTDPKSRRNLWVAGLSGPPGWDVP